MVVGVCVCVCVCVWLVCVGLCGAVICIMTISGLGVRVNPQVSLPILCGFFWAFSCEK